MGKGRKDLFVIGSGGLAREVAWLAQLLIDAGRPWRIAGFVGGPGETGGEEWCGLRVIGDDDWLLSSGAEGLVAIGIGHPQDRRRAAERYAGHAGRFEFPNLVHPEARLDTEHVTLGMGNVLTHGVFVAIGSRIGDFSYFNIGCTIGHDCRIGNWVTVNPGARVSGNCVVEDTCLLGAGCVVLEGTTVEEGATVACASFAARRVPRGATALGVPARIVTSAGRSGQTERKTE